MHDDKRPAKVSVLVLTYNASKFIRESLDSVLDQNYDDLQIVVSDDASRDGTQDIVRAYAEKYPGIFTVNLNEKNVGITRNANIALSLCSGDFVAFHAGDDVMLPGKIHAQVDYFRKHPDCVLCYHNLEIFDSATGKVLGYYNGRKNPAREGTVRELIVHGCFAGGNAVMVRRESLPPGGYNEAFPVASDWLLWIATTVNGGRIGYVNQVLAKYRRHDSNTTSTSSSLNRQAILDALNTTNWVAVNHPEYVFDALRSYSIHLRLLRRLDGRKHYLRALFASIKVWPTIEAFGAIAISLLTLGRVKP
ncbi:glycosyltransferase group 2 [Pandoraea capi]|uniref:Glycosyltransferase group 2 n=1 Tax=Pandoraea capi TaxID=2508286 RepID=A0ABY6W8H4_9BURK|nr:glycosyltransferase [Pandoraea capi]VVE39604.1 glycosyltransferase group 2 [Pandoraea capi]